MQTETKNPSATILEVEEWGFASTAAQYARGHAHDPDRVRDHVRESLRLHRFMVFAWLIEQGMKLPVDLVSDAVHLPVGRQSVDRPVRPEHVKD